MIDEPRAQLTRVRDTLVRLRDEAGPGAAARRLDDAQRHASAALALLLYQPSSATPPADAPGGAAVDEDGETGAVSPDARSRPARLPCPPGVRGHREART
jgi:hypothetical protein